MQLKQYEIFLRLRGLQAALRSMRAASLDGPATALLGDISCPKLEPPLRTEFYETLVRRADWQSSVAVLEKAWRCMSPAAAVSTGRCQVRWDLVTKSAPTGGEGTGVSPSSSSWPAGRGG